MSLVFKGLSKAYGTHVVLRDLSATLRTGIHYIRARNGGGKTTLLELASGMSKPTWGAVEWMVSGGTASVKSKRVNTAYCPAKPLFYEGSTVRDAVRLYSYLHGCGVERDPFFSFDPFGLSSVQRTMFGDLSFGWKKRVLLHMVFSRRVEILALDEPSVGLDSMAQSILTALIKARVGTGVTMIADHSTLNELSGVATLHDLSWNGAGEDSRSLLRVIVAEE